jgi:hypothetical protein
MKNLSRFIFRSLRCIAVVAFLLLGSTEIIAQDTLKKWNYRIEPYMMFPNMSGQTGIAGLPLADVDASASDIFSKLQMGFMLNLEAGNGTWAINSDFLYMSLEKDINASTLVNGGRVNAKQMGWEIAGFRRVAPWLEFGVGGLLNSLSVEVDVDQKQIGGGSVNKSGRQSRTWLDPMLITRMTTQGNKKLFAQLRGEMGGFGIGSTFAWQVQGIAGYRFSKLFDMSLGYRAISLDYQDGDGAKAFIYDVTTSGPMIRFGFSL